MSRRAPVKGRRGYNRLAVALCLVPILGLAATGMSYTTSRENQDTARVQPVLSTHTARMDFTMPASAYVDLDVDDAPSMTAPPEPSVPIAGTSAAPENTPESVPETPEPEQEPDHNWTHSDAVKLAKAIWGEARGCSRKQQAGVAWCAVNRTDSDSRLWPNDLGKVIEQPYQFVGYDPGNPLDPKLLEIAVDVLTRWENEKRTGTPDPGRVLPQDYYYFTGDGYVNYFRRQFIDTGEYWDWSLPSPYGD